MQYISINLYRKMIHHAFTEGMQAEDFARLPTPVSMIDSIQAVPADHFFGLHEMLDERLGPGFAVRVGQAMQMDDYGVLGLSWKTCSSAGEIFERCERYFKLLSNTYVFQVLREGDISHVQLNRDAYRRGVALSNEATFSATVVVLRAMTESGISPIQVDFKHAGPLDQGEVYAPFQCPVHFDQGRNVISYRTADLDMRTAKADESINRFLLERVDEETRGIRVSANRIADDVELLIKDALPSGIPSVGQVAEHMGMSNRTLTRRLAENDLTFRDLIRKSQEAQALHMLNSTSQTVAEIAFQTGFSEQSAFNRAFKRWTGQSPLEFRKSG